MRRRIRAFALLAALLLAAALPAPALGGGIVDNGRKEGVYAVLNQRMATRSGPNTAYSGDNTYSADTDIVVLEQVMGNGVPWGLVEFTYKGGKYRKYTGMKRLDAYGVVPWGNTEWEYAETIRRCYAYYGPGEDYARYDTRVPSGTSLQVFDAEDGYLLCDFYQNDQLHRRYIAQEDTDWYGDGYGYESDDDSAAQSSLRRGVYAVLNQRMATRMGPSTEYVGMPTYSIDTQIRVIEQEMGSGVPWGLVEFTYKGGKYRLYTGMKRIDVYEDVPWGNSQYRDGSTARRCSAYFGPGYDFVQYEKSLPNGLSLQVIDIENGFMMCDFTLAGQLHRLYIPMDDVNW